MSSRALRSRSWWLIQEGLAILVILAVRGQVTDALVAGLAVIYGAWFGHKYGRDLTAKKYGQGDGGAYE